MSSDRYEIWIKNTFKRKITGLPKPTSLPVSSEVFEENVNQAHQQVSVWKAALDENSPCLLPTDFGWEMDEGIKSLVSITMAEVAALAPLDVFKVIRYCCAPN